MVYSDLGRPRGKDDIHKFGRMENSLRLLRLPSITREDISAWGCRDYDAYDALLGIVESYVEAASEPEQVAQFLKDEESRQGERMDVIRKLRLELEAERDERNGDAIDDPWERRLYYLEYEEKLIVHKFGPVGIEHPGEPPEGYFPQSGLVGSRHMERPETAQGPTFVEIVGEASPPGVPPCAGTGPNKDGQVVIARTSDCPDSDVAALKAQIEREWREKFEESPAASNTV